MLQFNSIQRSSDLTPYNAKEKSETEVRCSEEKITLVSNIVSDFLNSIMKDTLTNSNPKQLYEYEVDPNIDVKSLRIHTDDTLYRIFKNNMYAVPDIYCKEGSEINPSGKLVIHAANTVRYIASTDIKLEREITDCLINDAMTLQLKNAIVYTGFDHMVSQLPNAYTTSRCKFIMDTLEKKGYKTHFEPVSMFITISIK